MMEILLLKLMLAFVFLVVPPVLLVLFAIGALARHTAKHIKRDYDRQGGAKVVVPKLVFGGLGKMAAASIRKRYFGW
jgi:hypothetical protein